MIAMESSAKQRKSVFSESSKDGREVGDHHRGSASNERMGDDGVSAHMDSERVV